MTRRLLQAVAWGVFLVLLVAAGLHFQPLVRQGIESSTRIRTTMTLLAQTRAVLSRDAPELRAALDRRLQEAGGLGASALEARRGDVRTRLAAERTQRRPELQRKVAWLSGAGLAQDLERDARIAVLETELRYLDALAIRYERVTQRQALLRRLYLRQLEGYERLRAQGRLVCPSGEVGWYDLRFTRAQVEACTEYRQARQAYVDERTRVEVIGVPAAPDTSGLFAAMLAPFAARDAELQRALDEHAVARHVDGIRRRLPQACAWLGGVLLTSLLVVVGVRALFYFVIAPAVSRRAPVRLLPDEGGPALQPAGRISAVSQAVLVAPGEELLLHPRYLQSSATGAHMNTRWLLSWRYPFSSIAARLVALTRIRTTAAATFVVSATERDAISEIGLLDLPAGTALVLQPRCLIGVLQPGGRPLRITRHWRLGTLGAWLTLQLRYLAFHGPVRLLVRGRRGVRLEAAEAGRAISQAATLGFGANTAYSQVRTETFFPYLMGRQALFKDRFAADGGVYLYEETTGPGDGSSAAGRGLTGLLDAVLKIFGI